MYRLKTGGGENIEGNWKSQPRNSICSWPKNTGEGAGRYQEIG